MKVATDLLSQISHMVQQETAADPAHDWLHIQRVKHNAIHLARQEQGDLLVIEIAALLHDIKNLPKSHPQSHLSSQFSADYAVELCNDELNAQQLEKLHDAVLNHSFSRGEVPKTIEGKILQDADRLDGIGAVGIARCFIVCGQTNRIMYQGTDPFAEDGRKLNDKQYTLDHFYQKLLKVPAFMQTLTGEQLAQERLIIMQKYLAELKKELFLVDF